MKYLFQRLMEAAGSPDGAGPSAGGAGGASQVEPSTTGGGGDGDAAPSEAELRQHWDKLQAGNEGGTKEPDDDPNPDEPNNPDDPAQVDEPPAPPAAKPSKNADGKTPAAATQSKPTPRAPSWKGWSMPDLSQLHDSIMGEIGGEEIVVDDTGAKLKISDILKEAPGYGGVMQKYVAAMLGKVLPGMAAHYDPVLTNVAAQQQEAERSRGIEMLANMPSLKSANVDLAGLVASEEFQTWGASDAAIASVLDGGHPAAQAALIAEFLASNAEVAKRFAVRPVARSSKPQGSPQPVDLHRTSVRRSAGGRNGGRTTQFFANPAAPTEAELKAYHEHLQKQGAG